MITRILFILSLAIPFFGRAIILPDDGNIEIATYTFAVKDNDTLRLDRYTPAIAPADTAPRPVLIYAFGGGFTGGERYRDEYLPMFRFLVGHGFTVVSTDYRTVLGRNGAPAGIEGFANSLQEAIGVAVSDLFEATSFVIANSRSWNIDPKQIVACGSSAGAITVLQAESCICNNSPLTALLPENFNYAGIIAMAGAVCAIGEPQWTAAPCPIMLFHGDADPIVPFDRAVAGGMGLWGSSSISRQLDEMGTPHYFHITEGAGHEINSQPMTDNLNEILTFLQRAVISHENRIVKTVESTPGLTDYKKDFTIEEYLRANMPR